MDRKSTGLDFDRETFVAPSASQPQHNSRLPGVLLLLVAVAGLCFLGYKFLIQSAVDDSGADQRTLAEIDQRMAGIEERIERIEQDRDRRPADTAPSAKQAAPASPSVGDTHNPSRSIYRISPPPVEQDPARIAPAADPAIAQKVAGIQQGLGNLQQDTAADHEAWQAATDRLADVSGQVGSQQVQLLRNQDELNQLLMRTQRTAIPFELHRGSEREPVGPITLTLKSTSTKSQRYTLCAYVQDTCVELKDRNRYEVVQFVTSRYSAPFEVIATSVLKDGITGYLEVPTEKASH
jgi:hypothetical protein